MRVLDLACHDGYIASWLAQRFEGLERLDAIELHPQAAFTATRRIREAGVEGECKVGAAEGAAELFEPGTYDAVVLYELIEHVPDVDRLLTAAEAMLRPGGQVYVSTPNGTFGEGKNPHHLRALRAIDLTEILRRRGQLEDVQVGADTVTAARYTPAPRFGEVAIWTGPSWMRWAPWDIFKRGLGGSETAAVRLAQELSKIGYVVTVYGDVEQGAVRDVIYRHHSAFDPLEERACVISSRFPGLFDRPVAARTRLLWAHDTDFGPELTEARAARIDRIVCLSEWHVRHVEGLYPFLRGGERRPSKVVQSRNGIDLSLFEGEAGPREKRVLYTSSPDRGLDLLLELWPEVRRQVPDAELAYAYAPVYWKVAEQDETVAKHAERIRELSDQEGVASLGPLPQPELAKLMRHSLAWCAPSWNTPNGVPFHETSCIGAMEAQAAGLHVVASNWGALSETVRVGRLISPGLVRHEADPGDDWRENFVAHIVEGLVDRDVQAYAQAEGPKAAAWLGWDGVGAQFAGLIEGVAPEQKADAPLVR